MARVRSPNREKAEQMYIEANGNIVLKAIADSLGVPEGTIRGWKNKDQWDIKMNGTLQEENTERSKRKRGGQPGNSNSKGNAGGAAQPGNKNAETHGFFSKYLPEDTFNIIQEIEKKDPLDILWENINIQYAAIIRAQRIMHVKDQEDLTNILKREKESNGDTSDSWEKEYELQTAWDKHATFLQAQSRAMATLERMIKQYDGLLNKGLATEEQRLRIEKLKIDINNSSGANDESSKEGINEFIKATTMTEDEVKAMFEGDEDGEEKETD
ncbi:terminase [Clostridium sp. 19966]|uniref:phage terminase small subunit n=1 Tax=Clostridium sp. 19966 TaxID=2768166 RepID=UPI0028DD718B|nr:phage terminase small subunit [Clostridium sp. 19966]MDT8715452.1 terminase [Clostridium sp. 19966]